MIPKIISINKGDSYDEIVSQFALQNGIEPSHRIVVQPAKDELTVDQIHLMQKDIQVAFSKKVLVVLQGVDDSSNEVQNSLLKCLEEDQDRILFLFLVKSPSRLLPTILSRCGMIENISSFRKIDLEERQDLFSFQKNSDVTRDEAVERIDRFIQLPSLKNHRILHHLLQIRKLILDNNMNPILALDNILIFLTKTSTINVTHEK